MNVFADLVYNHLFPIMGIALGTWGMVVFGKLYWRTRYYWKGIKFLICFVFTMAYFFMITDHFFQWWGFGPWFYIIVLRPINLLIIATLVLDIPHAN
jgi:hypothetical protein